jgi:hypothetical protein
MSLVSAQIARPRPHIAGMLADGTFLRLISRHADLFQQINDRVFAAPVMRAVAAMEFPSIRQRRIAARFWMLSC